MLNKKECIPLNVLGQLSRGLVWVANKNRPTSKTSWTGNVNPIFRILLLGSVGNADNATSYAGAGSS